MMSPVGFENSPGVRVIQVTEPGKALVDIDIVYKEIDNPVDGNADAHKKEPRLWGTQAYDIGGRTGNGENEEKKIIFLKKWTRFHMGLMMILMPYPKESVHEEFVG